MTGMTGEMRMFWREGDHPAGSAWPPTTSASVVRAPRAFVDEGCPRGGGGAGPGRAVEIG